jgi:hypothetical protein
MRRSRRPFATAPAIVTVLLIAGCGGEDKPADREKPAAQTAGKPYPRTTQRAYMKSCEANASSSACKCTLEALQDAMSYEDFKREDTALALGRPPSRKMSDAIASCR